MTAGGAKAPLSFAGRCIQEGEGPWHAPVRRILRKQRGILANATLVFAEEGMEKASMARIAAQAGVSKALLYHYYPSKDVLIFTIIMTHLEKLDKAIEAADDLSLEPKIRLRRLVGAVLKITGMRIMSTRCSSTPPLRFPMSRNPKSPPWRGASSGGFPPSFGRSTLIWTIRNVRFFSL